MRVAIVASSQHDLMDAPAHRERADDDRRGLARAAVWTAGATVLVQATGFLTMLVAARVLGPEPFGIAGMAAVVVTFLGTFSDFGLGPAIASGRLRDPGALRNALGLVLASGAFAMAATFFAAPLAAAFFRTGTVTPLLRAQSPAFVLAAAIAIPAALLQRQGRVAALAGLRVAFQLLSSVGTLTLLALDFGVWSLVVPGIVALAVMVPSYWVVLGEVPRPQLRVDRIRPFLREARHVAGFGGSNYVSRNADNAIVGRVAGPHGLGVYAFAYNLLIRPLEVFGHSLVPALVPAFGRLRQDRESTSALASLAVLGAMRIGTPVMIGGALTAHLFIPALFGPSWRDAVPLAQILMTAGALQIPGPVFGSLLSGRGDSTLLLRWGVWNAAATVILFLTGAAVAGAMGVAIGYLGYTCAVAVVMYRIARTRHALELHGLLSGLYRIGRDTALMVIVVLALDASAAWAGAAIPTRLAIDVAGGAAAYTAATRLLSTSDAVAIVALLPQRARECVQRLLRLREGAAPGAR